MQGPSAEQILDFNVRYHDLASEAYDSKWGIDYGEKGAAQVPGKMRKARGEPSRTGDRLAAYPKRAALAVAPVWRRLLGVRKHGAGDGSWGKDEQAKLEPYVDVHAFTPDDLEQAARAGGFRTVRIRGEELAASWFGWANRT